MIPESAKSGQNRLPKNIFSGVVRFNFWLFNIAFQRLQEFVSIPVVGPL
jgi:hypothetical protein